MEPIAMQEKTFSVVEMSKTGERLVVNPWSRATFTISRKSKGEVVLGCDLGMTSSDICAVANISIANPAYSRAIKFDPEFLERARAFREELDVWHFLTSRKKALELGSSWVGSVVDAGIFGDRKNQVYVHFLEPAHEELANLEISLFRSDCLEEAKRLKPKFTLCASLQLRGQSAHYFFFVVWHGNAFWSYREHIFYNNAIFFEEGGVGGHRQVVKPNS